MKKQSQNNKSVGQNAHDLKKSQKHEVNLQKNSTLYFQIGLILCLLGTFALFEMQFEKTVLKPEFAEVTPELPEYTIDQVKVYKKEVKEEPKKEEPKKKKLIEEPIAKEDNFEKAKEDLVNSPEDTRSNDGPRDPIGVADPQEPDYGEDFNIKTVEFVPVFPGCEKYDLNSEREKCLNNKMQKLVQKKFNTGLARDYGLSGLQRITVMFTVDKTGEIIDIQTRAPHPKLEKEAERIANKIPKMTPGKMGVTPVNVKYSLPINFKVEN